jgi:hypothetical protein
MTIADIEKEITDNLKAAEAYVSAAEQFGIPIKERIDNCTAASLYFAKALAYNEVRCVLVGEKHKKSNESKA